MRRLAVIGASGHGKVVADCAEKSGWEQVVLYDDAWPKCNAITHWIIAGSSETLIRDLKEFDGVIVAIGNNNIRYNKQLELESFGAPIVSVIHPTAVLGRSVEIGVGSVLMANTVVNVDSKLGRCCIVNTGATIDHDCYLEDGVHISPGANLAGNVSIGSCTWVGIGASVKQNISIGKNTIVAAGATVVNNVHDRTIVAGVHAKLLNR